MTESPQGSKRAWLCAGIVLIIGCAETQSKNGSESVAVKEDVSKEKPAPHESVAKSKDAIRFATYNASLNRRNAGDLVNDLESGVDERAEAIAEVIQRVRPDVLLINEFDFDTDGRSLQAFRKGFLEKARNAHQPIKFDFAFTAPVNTGEPSGFDLNNDGESVGADDAFGYGYFPGQYGMVVLSQFPIDVAAVRTFQSFLWRDMPNSKLSELTTGDQPYYSAEKVDVLRLASKSFWDVPVVIKAKSGDATIHFLVAHPTPPVFDGPEDRNGLRNFDEIRMIADYISPERSGYLVDDSGRRGGLSRDACFVIAGDLNSDPKDGSGYSGALAQLLAHPRVDDAPPPASAGGTASATTADVNKSQSGDPANDTADFGPNGGGNLRVDYVLPSKGLIVEQCGVFWPRPGEPGAEAIRASDHRLVWVDIASASLNACVKLTRQPK